MPRNGFFGNSNSLLQLLLALHGTHPSDSGRRKVAGLLLRFMKTDPTAKTWFIGQDEEN